MTSKAALWYLIEIDNRFVSGFHRFWANHAGAFFNWAASERARERRNVVIIREIRTEERGLIISEFSTVWINKSTLRHKVALFETIFCQFWTFKNSFKKREQHILKLEPLVKEVRAFYHVAKLLIWTFMMITAGVEYFYDGNSSKLLKLVNKVFVINLIIYCSLRHRSKFACV